MGKPRYTRHIQFSKLCNMGSEIKINQKCNKIGSVADGNHKIYLLSPYLFQNLEVIVVDAVAPMLLLILYFYGHLLPLLLLFSSFFV